jgi:hypothetical protein
VHNLLQNNLHINLLKVPLLTNLVHLIKHQTKFHLNRIIKLLKLLHLPKAVVWNLVALEVVDQFAITVTGVIGVSARKHAAVVPKLTLVQLFHHLMATTIIVPKLRSHSHAILMLASAPSSASKDPTAIPPRDNVNQPPVKLRVKCVVASMKFHALWALPVSIIPMITVIP